MQCLTRLEHAWRRWQVGGSVALALLALIGLIGAVGRPDGDEPEELRARAFVLVDREGKPRMDLRVARNDRAQARATQYTHNWQAHAQHRQPYTGRGIRQ